MPVVEPAAEAATTAAAAAGESSCNRAAAFCAARALASGVLAALEPATPERADANGVWWCGRDDDDGRGEAAAAAKNESAVLAPPRGVHGEGAAATFRRGTAALAPITPRAEDKGSGDVSDDEAAAGVSGG